MCCRVTCGSPLASLYSTYFPLTFPGSRRDKVAGLVPWTNCWRSTDPIATPMWAGQDPRDVEILDGAPRGDPSVPLRVHSDYWLEQEQQGAVEDLLKSSSNPHP